PVPEEGRGNRFVASRRRAARRLVVVHQGCLQRRRARSARAAEPKSRTGSVSWVDREPGMHPARAMWQRYETLHAVVYFAREVADAMVDVGLKGFWMGY